MKPAGKPVAELTLQLAENPINLLSLTDKTTTGGCSGQTIAHEVASVIADRQPC